MAASVYMRGKNEAGKWRYSRIEERKGVKTGKLAGPFYARYTGVTNGGKRGQKWHELAAENFAEAKNEVDQLDAALEAQSKGLTVSELDAETNAHRTPIRSAIDTYLEQKSGKAKATVRQYRLALNEFLESLGGKVRFLDGITESVIRRYKNYLVDEGYAGSTINTRLDIVTFLLKKNSVAARLPSDEVPTVEEEAAVPYTAEELTKLFAAMTPEEIVRYKFFLGTACRDREVKFASWPDIDFSDTKPLYHVRKKPDVGFFIKNHESRTIPLPKSLLALLKERRKNPPHPRWIFVNEDGRPDNHFLAKLKRVARRAGLNCGHCETFLNIGKHDHKRRVKVSCKDHPVCEHIYLHRFRKTCATGWDKRRIPVRTIQFWLGHKNLETTMKYLGITDSEELQGQINAAFGD